jgi:hypothetical protein
LSITHRHLARRALACAFVIGVAPALSVPASSTLAAEQAGDLVMVRGCVSGSALKQASVELETAPATFPRAETYRLNGPKAVRRQIKQAKGMFVEVRARAKPGPQAVTFGTTVGGTSIGVGVPAGSTRPEHQRVTPVPVLEVETIEVLSTTCEGADDPQR